MVMNYLRSKELQQHYQELQKLYQSPNELDVHRQIEKIQTEMIPPSIDLITMEPHVLHDSQLESWIHTLPTLKGTQQFIWNQIQHPTSNTHVLKMRQRILFDYKPNDPQTWESLKSLEQDVLWALHLPPLEKTWPMPLLFPQWFAIRWVNHAPKLLELYHLYRIYGAPLSHFVYPLTLLLGPWWYLRTKLKWNVTWSSYIKIIKTIFMELIRFRTGNPKEMVYKLVTFVVYVGLYIYGLIQSFDIAHMLYTVRKQLYQKLQNIHTFIQQAHRIWQDNPSVCENTMTLWNMPSSIPRISLSSSIQGIYRLYKDSSTQTHLKQLLNQMYILNAMHTMSFYQKSNASITSFPQWSQQEATRLYGMGHPCLPKQQQRNPLLLENNLIMTGPNAAGKTTYVRSVLANYIMAQSFGLCFAKKSIIQPVKLLASFMRVQDTIGSMSLYEAECQRCKELIDKAEKTSDPILFFLDEPMHATPPIEGASTAMALIKHLGQMPHVKLMITSHYHVLTQLETLHPNHFHNISMEAYIQNKQIYFNYQLRSGPSYQSIAIEMLQKDAFPESMLKDAIEFKNKICRVENK
jgi:hypothetical protein